MGVVTIGEKIADRLRKEADEVNSGTLNQEIDTVRDLILKEAEKSAKRGGYSARIYHDSLGKEAVIKALKPVLKRQGFSVAISEDSAYSEHAQKTMIYIEVTW